MKKILFLTLPLLCGSIEAMAQTEPVFQNPLKVALPEDIQVSLGATDYSTKPLGANAVIPKQPIVLGVIIQSYHMVDLSKYDSLDFTVTRWIKNYYNDLEHQKDCPLNKKALEDLCLDLTEESTDLDNTMCQPERAGVYNWYMGISAETSISGQVELDAASNTYINTWSKKQGDQTYANMPLNISARIASGYPYNVSEFQGVAHFQVFDPDSVVVASLDFQLTASNDSTKLEYVALTPICQIDSAREGRYVVRVEGAWLDQPYQYIVNVTDPLKDASSANVVDASYRLKAEDFTEQERDKWTLTTAATPSYVATKDGSSAMIVAKNEDDEDESFSLTQTIDKMPQGWYQLIWPALYQPCAVSKIKVSYPILGKITGNGAATEMVHVYDDATVTLEDEGYSLYIPTQDTATMQTLVSHYRDTLNFQVTADSILTLGAMAEASGRNGARIGLGKPKLMFHGTGLPYGKVSLLKSDSIYSATDSIALNVALYDGIGAKVPADNVIDVIVAKGAELTEENVVVRTTVKAEKADTYKVSMALPDPAEYAKGKYLLMVLSLDMNGAYQLQSATPITLEDGTLTPPTAVEQVSARTAAASTAYDLAGRPIRDTAAKGFYIIDGAKAVK